MDLRQLRTLVVVVDVGTLTEAAVELGVSQPAVSRTIAALEAELDIRLLHRTPRRVVPTTAGTRVVAAARRVLAEADNLVAEAAAAPTRLRLGYAWSAVGRHTVPFQRRWAATHPTVELTLQRSASPTSGLAEGLVDAGIVRVSIDESRFDSAVVGLEQRVCAIAVDDPWVRRRSLTLAEIATRPVLVDARTGTTNLTLWSPHQAPRTVETGDVDEWLDAIAAGRGVGVTSEATAEHHARGTVTYRRIRGAPPIPVRLAWWRSDPHPAVPDVLALLTELYRIPPR